MDNFERLPVYNERFGMYYVDFETGKRINKKSSEYFRTVIAADRIIEDKE